MSIWTRVYCEIRTPKRMSFEELQAAFGKECIFCWDYPDYYYEKTYGKEATKQAWNDITKYNQELADKYIKDQKAYLPTGSEGSLKYSRDFPYICSEDGRFKYLIVGSLRDWSDDIGVVKWFCDKFLGWMHSLTDIDEDLVYGYVSASMGVGEFSWEYGQKDIREEKRNE